MPELPEVEGARRRVERYAVGKTIIEAKVAEDDSEQLPPLLVVGWLLPGWC